MYKLVEESDTLAFVVACELQLPIQMTDDAAWVGNSGSACFQIEIISDHGGDKFKAMRVAIAKAARIVKSAQDE